MKKTFLDSPIAVLNQAIKIILLDTMTTAILGLPGGSKETLHKHFADNERVTKSIIKELIRRAGKP